MAITFKSAHSANATSVAITTPAIGDVIVLFLYNGSNGTLPATPSGYTPFTDFGDNGTFTYVAAVVFKISDGTETTTGVSTSTTSIVALIYGGVLQAGPLGAAAQFDTGEVSAGSEIDYPGINLTNTDGSSWVIGLGGSSTSSGMGGTSSGLPSNRTHVTRANGLDTNGGVTSPFLGAALTIDTAATACAVSIEILAAPSASRTEAATATESESAVFHGAASDTEAATASESESATMQAAASDSESAAATDSASATLATSASKTEAAAATETESGASSLVATETEAASAGDSEAATLSASASDSEAATATDAESASLAQNASDTETASATDADSGALSAVASDSETASATESESTVMSAVASDSEAATATDTESASRGQNASDSEAASAADSTDAVTLITFATSSAFPDYTPDTIACGSRYRLELMWGPPSRHGRGGAQFTAFRKFRRPRYVIELAWALLSKSQAFRIDAHVRALSSTLFPFHWFDWYPWWWRSVLVGIGDGATTQWVLPAKDVTDVTIFVGGATSSGGTDRLFIGGNIAYRIGPELEDGVDLFAPPAAGRPVWAYFRGRRRFDVRYANDLDQPLTRDLETGLYNVALKLVQTKVVSGS